jgi:hypothetical protein
MLGPISCAYYSIFNSTYKPVLEPAMEPAMEKVTSMFYGWITKYNFYKLHLE